MTRADLSRVEFECRRAVGAVRRTADPHNKVEFLPVHGRDMEDRQSTRSVLRVCLWPIRTECLWSQ